MLVLKSLHVYGFMPLYRHKKKCVTTSRFTTLCSGHIFGFKETKKSQNSLKQRFIDTLKIHFWLNDFFLFKYEYYMR